MVVGVHGPAGHHVAVHWSGDCHKDNAAVPIHLRLLLGVVALVTVLINGLVLVKKNVLLCIIILLKAMNCDIYTSPKV